MKYFRCRTDRDLSDLRTQIVQITYTRMHKNIHILRTDVYTRVPRSELHCARDKPGHTHENMTTPCKSLLGKRLQIVQILENDLWVICKICIQQQI